MTASTVVADASSEIERLLATPAAVLDAIPAAVSIVDRAGRWVRCNRRAADLAGVAPGADAIGGLAGFVRAFHPDGRPLPADEAPLAEVLATGVPVRDREVELERADGSRRIVLANVDPVRDPQGRLVGAVQCFHDITERASAERALRRSQQDLEDFFDNGAVGLHLVAADGTVLKANRAELDMLGYAPEEYIGQPISRFHADEPVIGDILQRLSCGEHLDRYPARLRARDGSIRHVLITSNVHFRDGEFLNTRCFTVDVTDWHQAEMERQAMERRLRSTLDMAPVGVAETDAEGRYLRVNPAMEAITGYTAGELLGLRFSDITHPDDRAREEAQYFGQLASGGAAYEVNKRYVRKDGSIIHVQVQNSVVRDGEGRFEYGVRIVQDVSERYRAAEALAASERRMRELFDALPVAIYTTDPQGRLTFYNRAAAEFSGREPELDSDRWCVAWKLYELDGTPMPHAECPMARTLREGVEVRGALALAERPDGTRVPFSPLPRLRRDADGNIVEGINILVDMSERLAAEQAQRVLIDELNHRVKNTLASVQSIASQTMRATPEAFVANFEGRIRALSRSHVLLTDRRWEGVQLRDLLESQLGAYAKDDGRLRLEGPDATLPPRIGLLLGMLVHELATNAAKYGALSRADGRIRLSWQVVGEPGGRRLRMHWRESGGPRVEPPARTGFGTRLLERNATKHPQGRPGLRFLAGGVECDLEFPLEGDA